MDVLFLDFNSYFASVEQAEREDLRNRPVAVVPVMADTTFCIAASYEAKAYGVKTGTRVSDAKRMCPNLQIVLARHETYVEYHYQLIEAVERCAPVAEVMSIDEMWCELTGSWRERATAEALAKRIKQSIAREVSPYLRCSVGIGPNVFIAKTASDMQKPDGQTVIDADALPEALFGLELRDLYGIGPRMEARLRKHGLTSVELLCRASKQKLRNVWGGVEGERFWRQLRGERAERHASPGQKTLGHSHVLPPALRNETDAHAVLHRLVQKAAVRLRKQGYYAAGMAIGVGYADGRRWHTETHVVETQDTLELIHALNVLWQQRPRLRTKPMHVGVTMLNLVDAAHHTPGLFDEEPRRKALTGTLDRLNLRYGKNTVYFGGAHRVLRETPMRIAFTRIPDPTIE
jgi:DNA polymerase-4